MTNYMSVFCRVHTLLNSATMLSSPCFACLLAAVCARAAAVIILMYWTIEIMLYIDAKRLKD